VAIHQDARVYAGLFGGDESATLPIEAGRRTYVHVARGSVVVNGKALAAGDAAMLEDEAEVRIDGGDQAEVLVFDLP
jgi:redox-sensitive bicupin YhaK (pirin superfamily)